MTNPIQILREATRAVPAVKYALGIGGILATVALLYSFRIDPRVAFVGTIVVLVLMGVLVVFARMASLSGARLHFPAVVFTWFVLLIFMATAISLFTSVFFKVPVNLQYWIAPPAQPTVDWKADNSPTYSLLQRINNLESGREKVLALLNFDSKYSLGLKARDELLEIDPELQTFTIGDKALIAIDAGRQLGYLIFLNMRDTTLALEDRNLAAGILNIQIIGPSAKALPNAIVEVEYNSMYGTGTYATSVKLYTINNGLVLLSLNKPQFEYNSGWGAFKSDDVEFKTKNIFEINPKTSAYEIRTIGIAAVKSANGNQSTDSIKSPDGTEFKAVRDLPDEFYVWNPLSRQFEQREGRIVAGQDLLTSVYSDFADPKGKWFRKPAQLPSRSRLERLYPRE